MNHVVIMAGGSGTRFWPLSRKARPKQLLPLWQGRTLLEHTVDRFKSLVPMERVVVVTGRHLENAIRQVLPDLPAQNLIIEPEQRNTAPCIGLAATVIAARDPQAIMGFFPADAYVGRPDQYLEACKLGFEAADQGYIATVGVRPTRPETGYGYVRYEAGGGPVFKVSAFVEKPDFDKARSYVIDGRYLWNAGIFFFSLERLRHEIWRQLPALASSLVEIEAALARQDGETVDRVFQAVSPISIDYGIMEGANDVVVIAAELDWNDVGHWASLGDVLPTDDDQNLCVGEVCAIDARDTVLISQGGAKKLLAVVGVEGLVVVDTETATLVLPKSEAQRVREIVDWIKARGRDDWL